MSNENKELNELLEKGDTSRTRRQLMKAAQSYPASMDDELCETRELGNLVQWTTGDNKRFIPASNTKPHLIPGVYEIQHSPSVGLFFEKIPVKTEGLLRFPQTNSDRVVKEIQNFWAKEEIFREYKLTYKRGIILWGPPGCHAKGTLIRMYDGSAKKVEDVRVGDELMGPDSKRRKVLCLKHGRENMYQVIPTKGESFVVNAHHVFHFECEGSPLLRRKSRSKKTPEVYYTRVKYQPLTLDVSVADYLTFSKTRKAQYKLKYTGVEYNNSQTLSIDPYFLGLWLGDGSKHLPHITNIDPSVVGFVYEYAAQRGLQVRVDQPGGDADCPTYALTAPDRPLPGRTYNCLQNDLRNLNLLNNKHIPVCYLCSSRDNRLRLLAGLLDTDGHYDMTGKYFEITQKSKQLAEDIVSLARSLGFLATISPARKTIKKLGFEGTYYRVNICGDLACVPVNIDYKHGLPRRSNKDNLRTGIKEIIPLGVGDYYGFELDSDHLYLTADYMIHHNSGKSCTIQLIMKDVVEREGIVIKFTNPGLFLEGMRVFREIEKETPVIILMEDIDSTLEIWDESQVLNILDGIDQVEKVVFLACPSPDHRILKADLSWVRADSLKSGDELIAFDENGPDRKYRTTKVNSCPIVYRPCYKIKTEQGEVTVSEKHPFLVKIGNRTLEWRSVEELHAGNRIATIGLPWDTDNSRDSGYLAGQYDGEGTLNFGEWTVIEHDGESGSRGFRVKWVQVEGSVAVHVRGLLIERKFNVKTHHRKPGSHQLQATVSVAGGRWESLRLLGVIRPLRLLSHPRLREAWEGARLAPKYVKVISVESIGLGPVVALDTTTKTFIGEGLLQHNTTNYPERLGARILNRPSRFDKRFKIGHPNAESRLMYFKHLIGEEKIAELNINLKKWVKDTEKFSIAHLKELFVAVVILGDDYKEAVETLSSMKEQIHSEDDKDKFMGFGNDRYEQDV